MNHDKLVHRADRWLRGQGYTVVLTEASDMQQEIVDAIGWKMKAIGVESCVIECKATRADFIRDRRKPSRGLMSGMGNLRYYLISPTTWGDDLPIPDGWGLLVANKTGIAVKRQPVARHSFGLCDAERTLLYVALKRRMQWIATST